MAGRLKSACRQLRDLNADPDCVDAIREVVASQGQAALNTTLRVMRTGHSMGYLEDNEV